MILYCCDVILLEIVNILLDDMLFVGFEFDMFINLNNEFDCWL